MVARLMPDSAVSFHPSGTRLIFCLMDQAIYMVSISRIGIDLSVYQSRELTQQEMRILSSLRASYADTNRDNPSTGHRKVQVHSRLQIGDIDLW